MAEPVPSSRRVRDRPNGSPDDPGETAPATLAGPVKLVVWDLDDTLWTGTLSEGPVVLDPSTADLVRALNRRGIVNSICSKNDAGAVRDRLQQVDLWEEFVFASVDWSAKGARVARMIEDAQLRPENVLFIDDLAINREEVRHAAPGVQTAGPEIIGRLASLPQLTGKDDRGLTRLHQYRMLEKKLVDRQATTSSNEAFLRSCDIHAFLSSDTADETDRLFELVHRTNQLNFTKRRPTRPEFEAMLGDPRYQTGYLEVRDRYGEYGICGFYALDQSDGTLTDFLFSCRILNMGVEQWLYSLLGRPPLVVVGEVASTLEGEAEVDWITEDPDGFGPVDGETLRAVEAEGEGMPPAGRTVRTLMVGGCDLQATVQFLKGSIATDFSRSSDTGALIHVEHTELLRQSVPGLTPAQQFVVDRLPFLDRRAFASPAVVAPEYDVLVYSVLMDYTQGLYRHRSTGLVVPWNQLDQDVTDPGTWDAIEAKFGPGGVDRDFLRWFADEFDAQGSQSVERFTENIRWLAATVPAGTQVILINGAEVPFANPEEPDRHLRHRTMNAALDEVVGELSNVAVCDVRTFIRSDDDLTDSIRHYRRHAYLRMAEEIRGAGATALDLRPDSSMRRAVVRFRRLAGTRRMQLQRALSRG